MASDSKSSDEMPILDALATPAYPNWEQLKDTPLPKDLLPNEEEDGNLPDEGSAPDELKKARPPKGAGKGGTTKGNWKEYRDADGKIYYFNKVSKESTRVKPTEKLETKENETSTTK